MKRAITLAILASLLLGLFGGYASAETGKPEVAVADEVDTVSDDVDIRRMLHFCRKLFGDDEIRSIAKEKCIELWKRWCNAHPDSRICPDRPPHPCRLDRVTDRLCPQPVPGPHPCRILDKPVDRRCPVPEPCLDRPADLTIYCPPPPCVDGDASRSLLDEVVCPVPLPIPIPHPCPPLDRLDTSIDRARLQGVIDRVCYPPGDPGLPDRPIDKVDDRPLDLPPDRPLDRLPYRVLDLPVLDTTELSKERVSNDAHFGVASADH